MNQNWIVENLNNAFSTWNGKLGELWGLVTTGPQTFKGGAVWSVMQTLHNGMVGIGYALVVLFFAIPLSVCSCRILTSVLQRLQLKQVTPSRARL